MRAKRICASNSDYRRQTREMRDNLVNRGYPARLVTNGVSKVETMDRRLLLEKNTKKKGRGGVPRIVTYSSHLPNIGKILWDKKCLLFRSDRLKNVFDTDMFVSYKRGTNLKDILLHKKTKSLVQNSEKREGDCGKNCVVCKVMYKQEERIKGPAGTHTCTYDKSIGCRSRNVVYGVFCEVCDCVVYVGETGGVLYQRLQNHLSTIRCQKNDMDVAVHFNARGHNLSNAKFVGLEKVWKGWVTYRRIREQRWVGLLGTHKRAGGLNTKNR